MICIWFIYAFFLLQIKEIKWISECPSADEVIKVGRWTYFQSLALLLEYPDMVHESDYPVSSHGGSVEAGSGQQGSHVKRHWALRRVEHKQFTPSQPEQRHLVGNLTIGEKERYRHLEKSYEKETKNIIHMDSTTCPRSVYMLIPHQKKNPRTTWIITQQGVQKMTWNHSYMVNCCTSSTNQRLIWVLNGVN